MRLLYKAISNFRENFNEALIKLQAEYDEAKLSNHQTIQGRSDLVKSMNDDLINYLFLLNQNKKLKKIRDEYFDKKGVKEQPKETKKKVKIMRKTSVIDFNQDYKNSLKNLKVDKRL